jgi:NADH:ubiquinone oxidoreductase subunit B-like Fe-S oxidoreductase
MSEDNKPIEVVFAPGCFDTFEGSQEELNELMAEIKRMAESGEMMERGIAVDFDELFEDEPELADKLLQFSESDPAKRNLQ